MNTREQHKLSKAKMQAARELILEKQYDAARAVLITVNEPTAHQWLDKLDEIAPIESEPQQSKGFAFPSLPQYAIIGAGLLVIIIVALVASQLLNENENSIKRMSESFCRWSARADDIDDFCREEVNRWLSDERDEVERCYIRSDEGNLGRVFFQCMMIRDVVIPTPYTLTQPQVTPTPKTRQNP